VEDWLSRSARRAPDRVALRAPGAEVTWAELDAAASRTARRLAARGVRAGDRVATTLPPGVAFAELLHALPRLGAAIVPLNTRLNAAERRLQLEDAAPRLVLDDPLDGDEADVEIRRELDPAAPHSLLFTSGTTARPKPVTLTPANHAASAAAVAGLVRIDPDDSWLCVLPLFHVGGLAILLRAAIHTTSATVHDGFDVPAVAGALAGGGATLASLVPTMLRRLVAEGAEPAARLRAILLGGGPIPGELLAWARERGVAAHATYGMTETASMVVAGEPGEAAGRPLAGAEVRVAAGGEILVRGPMVAAGALSRDGWLHTGDRGRLDADGRLHVEGRIKDVIVTGGENVAVAEVEDALLAHPAVADAGVAARPDPEWGELVVAHVVLAAPATDGELRAHCRARLAGYKVPKAFVRRDELPRNAAGKLLRGLLEPP
jgi:o-succinylbenzoate---CoA ligase